MKETVLMYWKVKNNVEMMNSPFMQTYELKVVLARLTIRSMLRRCGMTWWLDWAPVCFLLMPGKTRISSWQMQDYCWFYTAFEYSTPRLGGLRGLRGLRGEAMLLPVLPPRAGPSTRCLTCP